MEYHPFHLFGKEEYLISNVSDTVTEVWNISSVSTWMLSGSYPTTVFIKLRNNIVGSHYKSYLPNGILVQYHSRKKYQFTRNQELIICNFAYCIKKEREIWERKRESKVGLVKRKSMLMSS
jgi:hypothetical protein